MSRYIVGCQIRRRCCVMSFAVLMFTLQAPAQTPTDWAWSVLQEGMTDKTTEERAVAVRVLGLLEGDAKAQELAVKALGDSKPEVRAAAADALGQMKATSAASKLADIVLADEKEPSVLLSCARSMIVLGDNRGYGVYYAVLTGEKKSGGSLLDDQKKMLSDPKKLAQIGFEQGIGFIPFAGLGYAGIKMLTKDDSSPVRAAAARILSKDPDTKTEQALVQAVTDKSWIVRMAAIDALAQRNNPAVIPQIVGRFDDEKDVVRYTAAAAVLHLSRKAK